MQNVTKDKNILIRLTRKEKLQCRKNTTRAFLSSIERNIAANYNFFNMSLKLKELNGKIRLPYKHILKIDAKYKNYIYLSIHITPKNAPVYMFNRMSRKFKKQFKFNFKKNELKINGMSYYLFIEHSKKSDYYVG